MICQNCGRELPEGVAFCDNCGASQPAPATAAAPTAPVAPSPVVNNFYAPNMKQPVSVAGWIGRSLIPCIPLVGWLIYLIMLFMWAGDQTKETSFNNWAKAQLWVMLIGLGIAVFVLIIVAIIAATIANGVTSSVAYTMS